MRILLFFELRPLAISMADFFSSNECVVEAACELSEVRHTFDSIRIDGVIIPIRAVPTWWQLEPEISDRITCPRIVFFDAQRVPSFWSREVTDALGFDGCVAYNFQSPPIDFRRSVARDFVSAPTRGARPPDQKDLLVLPPSIPHITDLEPVNLDILMLITLGKTDDDIARTVCLAPQTIRNRIHKMLQLAQVRNRTELGLLYQHYKESERHRSLGLT